MKTLPPLARLELHKTLEREREDLLRQLEAATKSGTSVDLALESALLERTEELQASLQNLTEYGAVRCDACGTWLEAEWLYSRPWERRCSYCSGAGAYWRARGQLRPS